MAAPNSVSLKSEVKVPQKAQNQLTMKDWIVKSEKAIAKALPKTITPERFARIATTAVTQNPQLGECTPPSFIGSLLTAAQLGLEPNTPLGQAYLIPYRNYKTGQLECQFQLGYRGMIELAHRSGEFKSLEAHVVYENDEFIYELGLDPKLVHKPTLGEKGKPTWVYAIYRLKSGGYGFEVMSKAEIDEHRKKYSKAKNSPWDSSWDGMAKKTVIKQALKYAPLKSEFFNEMAQEEVTLNFNDKDDIPIVTSDESTRYEEFTDVEVEVEK